MKTWLQSFFLMLAGASDKELARQVEYLKAENRILRDRLPKRLAVTPQERQRLLRFGKPLGPAIRELITIVSPRTFARWLNAESLAEHLVESELFGHRKGAFTGADRDHKGLFEVANGGTLFLDEVGELNKNIQVKLLRFLESGEIRRVGDTEPFRTDVRVLCATNRDLRAMIREDDFREDLYFRINTFEVRLPPLRERRQDIPELARHLLARAARRPAEQVAELLTPEVIDVLLEHEWQGNVRELANVMEHAYILAGGGKILPEHVPHSIRTQPGAKPTLGLAAGTAPPAPAPASAAPRTLREIEMEYVLRALEKHGGSKAKAADELGISLKTMYNKLNQLQEERKSAG